MLDRCSSHLYCSVWTLQDRDELFVKLTALDLPNVQPEDNLYHTQMKWLEGRMTNFEYLMNLNKMAGRSFNDLMQYPVFPFILSQYTESTLDLERPSSYRFNLFLLINQCRLNCCLSPMTNYHQHHHHRWCAHLGNGIFLWHVAGHVILCIPWGWMLPTV